MNSAKLAIITLDPPPGGYGLLFKRDIAGVPLFKRWMLTLDRAGVKEMVIVSRDLSAPEWEKVERGLQQDNRFKAKLRWFDGDRPHSAEEVMNIVRAAGTDPILLAAGNIVTSPTLIKTFVQETLESPLFRQKLIVRLGSRHNTTGIPGGVYLLPAEKSGVVENFLRNRVPPEAVELSMIKRKYNFWTAVSDARSARQAEMGLLQQSKSDYYQFMDVAFNAKISMWIAAIALKTPLTPNQLTLLGLPIALIAGITLAQGGYWWGLMGGIVTAGTTIWDCVDGAVARLKFMQSDFGEYLDTLCDNITNVVVFIGITIGVAHDFGPAYALIPCSLLALGGITIYGLIYYPKVEGKGGFFKGTKMYEIVQVLASRNFIYIILLFAVIGKLDWFLWLAGFGSLVFAAALYWTKRHIATAPNS